MKRRFIMRLSIGSIIREEVVEVESKPSVILGAMLEDARIQREYGRRVVTQSVRRLNVDKKEYIEREAALRAILGQPPELHFPDWYKGNIMEVPAADVAEVVHGEWVEREIAKAAYLSCSCCGWVRIGVPVTERYRYCPGCGAKMDGGKEQ